MSTAGPLVVGLVAGRAAAPGAAVWCGVGDYTRRLAEALREAGVDARLLEPAGWGVQDGMVFARRLRRERLDLLHVQYPCLGHRRSVLPHLLGRVCGARASVVTLHEHSALPRAQRAANWLFRLTSDRLVFTTAYEAGEFGAPGRGRVIPIGSNVPVHPHACERDSSVLYFGQIRPGKGLEAFLALAARAAAEDASWHFRVIGSAPPRWSGYARALQAQAASNVSWILDRPLHAVGEAMAGAMAAYLPFPDGASLRRGSLLAAFSNRLPVLAPLGAATTEALRAAILPAATPEMALGLLRDLRADPGLGESVADAGEALARQFGWAAISDAHVSLYREALSRGAPSAIGGLAQAGAAP